jgi:hypothetical protein
MRNVDETGLYDSRGRLRRGGEQPTPAPSATRRTTTKGAPAALDYDRLAEAVAAKLRAVPLVADELRRSSEYRQAVEAGDGGAYLQREHVKRSVRQALTTIAIK